LLDEPLGALDRTLRERLTGELQALFRSLGLTVVTVTHDQTEAFALADRLVVMGPGRILRTGTPSEVWDDPRHVAVARLLGFGNLLAATVAGGVATTPWGTIPVDGASSGAATVLVRPSGVRVVADGGVLAIVEARTFAGDRTTVRVRGDGTPPLDATMATAAAPAPGDQVRVRLDHRACRILEA
jgi:thiamine transport system ATP-binding protein